MCIRDSTITKEVTGQEIHAFSQSILRGHEVGLINDRLLGFVQMCIRDRFYDGLPSQQKYRTHFHRFMRRVQERLREHAGQSDPLAKIAEEWRDELRVLVLDLSLIHI